MIDYENKKRVDEKKTEKPEYIRNLQRKFLSFICGKYGSNANEIFKEEESIEMSKNILV